MRKGIHTSEFWVTIATQLGNLAAAVAGELPPNIAAPAAIFGAGLYAFARAYAKQGDAPSA